MSKNHDFKIFQCNPNNPNFDLSKFLGEIDLYVSKLHTKNAANKVISEITNDFKQTVAVTKLKELKRYAKNILPNYKKWEMRNEKWEMANEKQEMRNEKLKNKKFIM